MKTALTIDRSPIVARPLASSSSFDNDDFPRGTEILYADHFDTFHGVISVMTSDVTSCAIARRETVGGKIKGDEGFDVGPDGERADWVINTIPYDGC